MELHEYSGRRWVVVNGEKISDPRMLARHLPSPSSEQGLVGFCRAAIFLLFGRAFHVIADPLTYRQKANAKLHPRSAMKDTANLESTRIMELDLESIEPPRVSEDLVFFVEDARCGRLLLLKFLVPAHSTFSSTQINYNPTIKFYY